MKKLLAGCAVAALAANVAHAQSTGSETIESREIVVTGTRRLGVDGVVVPDVPKTRSILTQEFISRQPAGQSILNTINQIPGVNYTNSDPYGSSGGNLRIRGFPGNRIAFLWDGLPLNDTGNYAIFGNQAGDPEVIDQVSVNLGSTDVDSPTPSAAGGVVSYRTLVPSKDFSAIVNGSIGSFSYGRVAGIVQTGDLFGTGVRALFQGSSTRYNKFRGPGGISKDQANVRIYKELSAPGDFVSVAGHYNRNRNVFYNNGLASDFALNRKFDYNAVCARDPATTGVADNDNGAATTGATTSIQGTAPTACTNYYNLRINPSNTANIRGSARLTLSDKLIVTVDPGYQYTLANGGGTNVFNEYDARFRGTGGALGVDLNQDGDILDAVRLYNPNVTRTNRYTLLASLIYQLNDTNRFRVAYTFDRGEHRQTAQLGTIDAFGDPISVFAGKHTGPQRVLGADGKPINTRNRYSVALLNQISGEYFGKFLDDKVTVTLGLRAPFFERKLNQYCYTANQTAIFGGTGTAAGQTTAAGQLANGGSSITGGNPYCTTATLTASTPFPATAFAPFKKDVKYSPLLPSGGVTFNLSQSQSVYVSYGRNFSSPSTDNLYRSVTLNPKPETTDAIEGGYRFRSSRVQAQVATYYTKYKNRIVTSFDGDTASPTFGQSVDRNVGDARSYGFDAQAAYQPIRPISLYGFVSYINAKLKDNFNSGATAIVPTAGAYFVETPKWQYGGRVQGEIGPFSAAAQVKHVSSRYSTDDNGRTLVTTATAGQTVGQPFVLLYNGLPIAGVPIDPNGRVHGYTTLDLDARVKLSFLGMGDKTFFSFNVINVTNKYYFGNLSTQNTLSGGPRFSVGAPRTYQGSLQVGF